ncbi:rab11 family-interacting protein 3 isoform X2 [Orcinus orca]|uniref:rab11 family-interacting protein 3 isoform X2 n=1 Tax=Orcinus orca TaxID=9733 RepID=UPI0014417C53|nr:rab11 family-interacting protein 3 isoform X2 [Orcinus orca]
MKMDPSWPASPAGGPGPDPEPGGPGAPAAPAPRPGLGPQDLAADADAGRAPGRERQPQRSSRDSDPDPPLPELGPLFSWMTEQEGDGPPHSASGRAQDFSRSHHLRGEVDFFPSFASPAVGEPALELGPGDPDRPSDFSQTCPLTSEPAGCPEDGPRLRAVFDALDGDGDGFVRIEDFVQFATVYGAEQVKDLTRYLDPSGLGVISFEDFYQGITAIRNGDPDGQLCSVTPAPDEEPPACPEEFDDFVTFEANEVTDSAYMGSESTYSECETFTDEDTGTLVPPECLDATEEPGHGALLLLPGRSHLHSQSVVTVIGGEEHFEDYGEGSEAELSPETLCNGEHGCRDPIFLTPSADPLAAKLHSILTDEAFEFYCSQCHKQINRLEDLSARLNDLEKNSPSKRLSSKKVASFGSCPLASCSERHLHQSGALTMEALQDPPPDPVEGMEEDIADKVVFLEKRVSELEKDTAANGEQHSRLRQENLQLVHRLFTARGVVFGVGKLVTLCTSPQFAALLLQRTRDLACVQPEPWGHRPLSRGPEAGSTACVLGEAWPCRTLCSPRLFTLRALVPALDTGPEALGDAGLLLWLLLGEMGLHDLSSCSWRLGTGMCHAVLGASPTAITEQQKHVLLCGRDPGSGATCFPALLSCCRARGGVGPAYARAGAPVLRLQDVPYSLPVLVQGDLDGPPDSFLQLTGGSSHPMGTYQLSTFVVESPHSVPCLATQPQGLSYPLPGAVSASVCLSSPQAHTPAAAAWRFPAALTHRTALLSFHPRSSTCFLHIWFLILQILHFFFAYSLSEQMPYSQHRSQAS